MRVRVHPADPWGCGHYRLTWPAEALRAQGYDVEVVTPGTDSGVLGAVVDDRLVRVELDTDEVDVYVFQRATNVLLVDLIEHLRRRGKTVVVDMDDDLTCIHPRNPAFHLLHPQRSPTNNWRHAERACRLASLVTVSTPELQRRYGVHRSRVLRNCVPRRYLDLSRVDGEPVWGWAGALHSHPDDLPLLGGAVTELRRRGHEFVVVGHPDGTGRALGLAEDPRSTGRVEFEAWGEALTQLSVGAAPLADTRFNRAKSWLKPLEYAACGVPWVASGRAEYRELRELGAGFLVGDRTRDWVGTVQRLLTDEAFRVEASETCRAVAARVTIEEHAWRWLETWQVAYQLDRGVRPSATVR